MLSMRLLMGVSLSVLCLSCSDNSNTKSSPSEMEDRLKAAADVDASNYLSGRHFCQTYSSVTAKEKGHFINVPKDYKNPNGETVEIYFWTVKDFDPKLPTMIYMNGGPGQTSHESEAWKTKSDWNQINMDQRGLGCSAPATFELYKDASSYSTTLTVKDMEEIRKFYSVSQWTIYGISYGTIPATRYGHEYMEHTKAVVLEGTAFSGDYIHEPNWKAKKLNEMLAPLSSEKRNQFSKIINSNKNIGLLYFVSQVPMYNDGYKYLSEKILKLLLVDGQTEPDWDKVTSLNNYVLAELEKTETGPPQKPSSIDRQLNQVLFCRELGRSAIHQELEYNVSKNEFYAASFDVKESEKGCEKYGVDLKHLENYVASDYPVVAPMTYFQGMNDGATHYDGALKHFQTVPKGRANFLVRKLGGHNPNLQTIQDEKSAPVEIGIFELGLLGQVVPQSLVTQLNTTVSPENSWSVSYSAKDLKSLPALRGAL